MGTPQQMLLMSRLVPLVTTYATWNPSDKSANVTLSNGNLTASGSNGSGGAVRANQGKSSGKWYWEITQNAAILGQVVGVGNATMDLAQQVGITTDGWSYYGQDGKKYNGAGGVAYGNTFVAGTIISYALDMDNGKLWFAKAGTWQNSGDPAAGTNAAFTGLTGTLYPAWSQANGSSGDANFGASAFTYTVPTGFNAGVFTLA